MHLISMEPLLSQISTINSDERKRNTLYLKKEFINYILCTWERFFHRTQNLVSRFPKTPLKMMHESVLIKSF